MQFKIFPELTPYAETLVAMETHIAALRAGDAEEQIWLLQHPPLYTAGTSAKEADLLNAQFPVFQVGRGGQYTYHGPGQRVAYVMIDLAKRGGDVRHFVRSLEEVVVRTLQDLGIAAGRRAGRIGLWVGTPQGDEKIAAIGVRVTRGVTWHGLSLNVHPDLTHFAGIVPCGLGQFGVTSLQALGKTSSLQQVDELLITHFKALF